MKRLSKMINGRSSSSKTRHAAAEQAEVEKITAQKVKSASLHEEKEEEEDDDDDEADHRLRQNPSKTCKVSTSKNTVNHQQRFVCNKCGKAFQSSKAMCGHMACHSEKEKPSSNVSAKKKLVMMDSESDSESGAGAGAGQVRRRSRRTRYKKPDYVADSKADKFDVANNCSSEASGIEQEQEEVAICLMMLSRDSANWGGLNSIGDSSDNNSVVLEDRSISTKLRKKDGWSSEYDLNEIRERYRRKKIKSLGDFGFRNVKDGVKNVETDVKIKSLRKNTLEEDAEFEPHLSHEKLKSLMDGDGYSQIQRPKMESYPRRGALPESYIAEMCKRVEHKALIHSQSHQPFDVNVASNKQYTYASPYECSHSSFETDAYHNMRKGKGILGDNSGNVGDDRKKGKCESPNCSNEFGTNCELACQGRVHLAEVSEDFKCDEDGVPANFKRTGIQSHDFIDLNLPAPMEDEEANESMGSY